MDELGVAEGEPTRKGWRDYFPPHPAAELWPLMSPDELAELAADIERGSRVQLAIITWCDPDTGITYVLDGRNRLDALEKVLGLDVIEIGEDGTKHFNFGKFGGTYFVEWRSGNPWEITRSLNAHRRHQTKTELADRIAASVAAEQAEMEMEATAAVESPPANESPKTGLSKRAGSKSSPVPGKRGGSSKGVTAKAISEGAKHGVSRTLMTDAIAKQRRKLEPDLLPNNGDAEDRDSLFVGASNGNGEPVVMSPPKELLKLRDRCKEAATEISKMAKKVGMEQFVEKAVKELKHAATRLTPEEWERLMHQKRPVKGKQPDKEQLSLPIGN